MARTIEQSKITTRTDRKGLGPGLHWHDLGAGLHLGWRSGKWVTRTYLGQQRYRQAPLGTADDEGPADGHVILSFAQAAAVARKRQIAAAVPAGPLTVRQGFADYVEALSPPHKRSPRQSREARTNLDLHVPQRLFDKPVAELTRSDVESIQRGLVKMTAEEAADPEMQRRKRATCNRVLATVKAALNRAQRNPDNKIASNSAWQIENFRDARGARTLFLDTAQQQRLVNSARGAIRNFIVAALLTGLRPPHEIGALKVRDFSAELGVLELAYGKTGSRTVYLTDEAVEFFSGLAVGRDPDAPLVPRDDGKPWATRRNDHLQPMNEAVKRAKLPKGTTAYVLRHSYISSAMLAGMPLKVIADNVGTSVLLIEKVYGKYAPTSRRQLIAAHGPQLGLAKPKVRAIR